MESRQVSATDGISRFLSLLAILVALGASVFLYQDNQRLKTELTQISSSHEAPAAFESHAAQWDEKLQGALAEFTERATVSMNQFDKARDARNSIVEAAIQPGGLDRNEVERIVDAKLDATTLVPELRLANTVMSPASQDAPVPTAIANVGRDDATIRVARFLPIAESQFRVTTPTPAEPNEMVVQFDTSHNSPKKEGYHRFYERNFILDNKVVLANQTVNVSVEIDAQGRHLNWGMLGNLELKYQDGRSIVIPKVRAIFVENEKET